MTNELKQQVEVTVKLTLWLDAALEQEEIGVYTRQGLYAGFEDQAEFVDGQTMVDILDIREEAEIYGTEQTEHTQGPWGYEVSSNAPDYFDINDGCEIIAQVERWNGDGDDSPASLEAEANARLIAAAPETAAERDKLKTENEELIRLVSIFQGWIEQGQIVCVSPDIIQEISKRNLEAVTKAKGSRFGSSKERQTEELENIPDDMKCEAFINVYPHCVVLHEFEYSANDNADHDRSECVKVILGYKNGKISLIEGEAV